MTPSRPDRALLLSDPGELLALGRAVLRGAAARVQVVTDHAALAAELALDPPALVAVDLGLQWAAAAELARAVRARWPGVRLAVLVDRAEGAALQHLVLARPDAVLPAGAAGWAALAAWIEATPAPVAADAPTQEAPAAARTPPTAAAGAEPPADDAATEPDRSLAELAHDLHQPLRTLERTATRLAQVAGAASIASSLQGDLRRLRDLVDGALASAGHPSLRHPEGEAVDSNEVLAEVIASLDAALAETGGAVEPGPLPPVTLPPADLRRVLQNLVSNALHHGGSPPRVEVAGRREGPWSVLVVRDNGPGIPADQRERIFEPLTRLAPGWTHGRGLGLSICKRLVERGGGWIEVDEVPAGGASFSVWLPAPWEREVTELRKA